MINTSTFPFLRPAALSFLLLLISLFPALAQGSDTVYYNNDREKLKSKSDPDAAYYVVTTFTDTTQAISEKTEKGFFMDGKKKSENQYVVDRSKGYPLQKSIGLAICWYKNGQVQSKADYTTGKRQGPHIHWFEDGQIEQTVPYTDGEKEGAAFYYYPNGKIRRQEMFARGTLVKGKYFTRSGADTVYFPSEEQPKFKGGEQALNQLIRQNLRYPKVARKRGIEGLVVAQFVVNKAGEITDTRLIKKVSPEIDAESLRVLQLMSGKFHPARMEGKPVSFRYTLPIRFGLK